MRRARRPGRTLAWQALICVCFLSIWQWGYDLHGRLPWLVPDLLDPYFVSKPSEIFEHFLILSCLKSKLGVFNGWFNGEFGRCMARSENNLWIAVTVSTPSSVLLNDSGTDGHYSVVPNRRSRSGEPKHSPTSCYRQDCSLIFGISYLRTGPHSMGLTAIFFRDL